MNDNTWNQGCKTKKSFGFFCCIWHISSMVVTKGFPAGGKYNSCAISTHSMLLGVFKGNCCAKLYCRNAFYASIHNIKLTHIRGDYLHWPKDLRVNDNQRWAGWKESAHRGLIWPNWALSESIAEYIPIHNWIWWEADRKGKWYKGKVEPTLIRVSEPLSWIPHCFNLIVSSTLHNARSQSLPFRIYFWTFLTRPVPSVLSLRKVGAHHTGLLLESIVILPSKLFTNPNFLYFFNKTIPAVMCEYIFKAFP